MTKAMKRGFRSAETMQWEKVLATKPEDLSLIGPIPTSCLLISIQSLWHKYAHFL